MTARRSSGSGNDRLSVQHSVVGSNHEKVAAGVSGPLTGRLLSGKWRVGELLGLGGMSSVYAATHRNGKRFAIKVLRADRVGEARTRRRFLREGYIANRVGHAGVVAVLDDHVTDDGPAFLIMELLEGQNLEQYCAEQGGTLPAGEVLAIADAVLDILIAAHARQIVHRDIKPSNLFLTSSGVLKLLDFGIASLREVSGVVNATGDGVVLGTPGFMAPEQARGRRNDIDARTDLWGVGALMFRLLTGRLVYETESTNEYVVAAATQSAPSLASMAPSLPEGLVQAVDRALKSDAAARWQTAVDMQKAIRDERAQLAYCRLPQPAPLPEAVTLEESKSVNGTSNELPSAHEISPDNLASRTGLQLWPYLAYGGVGGALLVAVFGMSSPTSPPTAAPKEGPAPMQTEVRTFVAPVGTVSGPPNDLGVGQVSPVEQVPAPVARSASSNAPSIGTATATGGRKTGAQHGPSGRSDAGSSIFATSPSRPARLEDVLGERR